MPAPAAPSGCIKRQVPSDIRPAAASVNRGLAIMGDNVFMGTLDAAPDRAQPKTGALPGT